MNKKQLAEALAAALNLLNDIQDAMDNDSKARFHGLLAVVPVVALDECDYFNNGTIEANELTKRRR